MKKFNTDSDAGSVKIGINGAFTFLVPNGVGDGDTIVYVCDCENEKTPDKTRFLGFIKGEQINIYAYDCGGDWGDEIIETLHGRYAVYTLGGRGDYLNVGAVCFEKF